MRKQARGIFQVISLILLYLAAPIALGQSRDLCSDNDSRRAWEDPTNPVYAEAMELARTLTERGIVVECVRRSKQENLFEG